MKIENRKNAFAELGGFLRQFTSEDPTYSEKQKLYADLLTEAVDNAIMHNGWFNKENIHFNLSQWGDSLNLENLEHWISAYDLSEENPQKIGIIMAGNIPLVGFHDFMCVLLSGHKTLIKQSSKDKHLLPCLAEILIAENGGFLDRIEFADGRLTDFDAVIATGSNNTGRYFEHYFSQKPNIIRKNRNSVAVLTGNETAAELKDFGEDVFRYYGLGCRNVSKVFVPGDYDFTDFFEAIYAFNPIINAHKYANNYDYNKAVYLMSEFKILDNGFLILKEDKSYASPIACLFYGFYEDRKALAQKLEADADRIQCVVSSDADFGGIPFGQTQCPRLDDYADGVDTLGFLSNL